MPERELVAREPVVHTRDAIAAELQRSPASVLVSYCSDWQQRERDKRGRDEESDEDKNRRMAFPPYKSVSRSKTLDARVEI